MATITPQESLLLQSLATTSLLAELSNANFFESDYFNLLQFESDDCKQILKQSGIGNPATMQMMLYTLLVIPKEIFDNTMVEKFKKEINPIVFTLIEKETYSTYKGEDDNKDIDYFSHIRNAVSHSQCNYTSVGEINYVTFYDKYEKWDKYHTRKLVDVECSIKIKCVEVGKILMKLQILIIEYYNNNHSSTNS